MIKKKKWHLRLLIVRIKLFKDSSYSKNNKTSKESDKMIVTIQPLRILFTNMVKMKELYSKI